MDKTYVVYIDGIYDLFHRGHLESLRKAKEFYKNVFLIVGVVSDSDAQDYKRKPIFNEEDRYLIINSIKYVDKVIFPAPMEVTDDFLKSHSIDIYLHGFSNTDDFAKQEKFFQSIIHKFSQIPYYKGQSTSQIIDYIKTTY